MIRTILLVEDDRSSAFLVRRVLEKEGYHVFLAGNGREALQLIAKQPVDVVVTDVVMPIMDGVDLYEALKKRPDTQSLPVIIITDKQLFKDAFSALGVEHFVPKADNINILLDKIKNINQDLQKKEFQKVLVSGENPVIIDQMRNILVSKKFLVSTADNSVNTLQQAFLMVPHIILLDLRMHDHAQAKELVKAFKCFQVFYKTQLLTYSYIKPEEVGHGAAYWQVIEHDARGCDEVGAKFIGNFSQVTFLQNIKEYVPHID
ncbi:MAG: response regulator [Candidatus Omnitrophica bacterium]|nr:response regulator [Candidatus Omnitrophota bacterium]